jgi:hypothetical protein
MSKVRCAPCILALALSLPGAGLLAQTQVPPKASSPAAEIQGVLGEMRTPTLIVRLSSNPTPPVRGSGWLVASLSDSEGRPVTDAQVSFDLDMITMSHGKNIVAASPQGRGRYIGQVRYLMPGPWRVIVRVESPGQAPEALRFQFNVKFR